MNGFFFVAKQIKKGLVFILDRISCFPLHFSRVVPLLVCFITTEQSPVEASSFAKGCLLDHSPSFAMSG